MGIGRNSPSKNLLHFYLFYLAYQEYMALTILHKVQLYVANSPEKWDAFLEDKEQAWLLFAIEQWIPQGE